MTPRGWLRGGVGVLLVVAAVLLPGAQSALADSGSLTVANAGGGSMSVTAEATLTVCGEQFCGWSAAVRERHSSLPCTNSRVFGPGVVGFQAQAGTMKQTLTFRPFFPRSAKLCLYIQPTLGSSELVAEATYPVPAGYGYLRSTSRKCSDFDSQAAAQYYLYLYPDNPSGLRDANGLPCGQNPCPCGAERIPPEPPEQPSVQGKPLACIKARAHQRREKLAVKVAERQVRKAARPIAQRRWSHKLKTRKAALRKAKQRVRKACLTS